MINNLNHIDTLYRHMSQVPNASQGTTQNRPAINSPVDRVTLSAKARYNLKEGQLSKKSTGSAEALNPEEKKQVDSLK